MSECKVWVLDSPSAYNNHGKYECEFTGSIEDCFAYVQAIEPRYGWVITDSRNKFLCSGDVAEAWEASSVLA